MPPLVPLESDTEPSLSRSYAVTGRHSRRCADEAHPDWMHSFGGCAVGSDKDHCDCTAHYTEIRF